MENLSFMSSPSACNVSCCTATFSCSLELISSRDKVSVTEEILNIQYYE